MNKYRKPPPSIKNLGATLLTEGKNIRIKAHGYSMYPAIKPGSLIIIEPITTKGKPVEGEIIAIKREQGLIVHRLSRVIIKDGTRYYIARGDSNAYADNCIISGNSAMMGGGVHNGILPGPLSGHISARINAG